jgi:hypothetical protein
MGRQYAGILGPLACTLVLARGIAGGRPFEPTLIAATCGLFGFAALGWIVGKTADYLVQTSVRSKFEAAMAEQGAANAKSAAAS